VQISGVRFWNLTASTPAWTAASIIFFGDFEVAVVIDADFGHDEGGVAVTDHAIANFDFTFHSFSTFLSHR